MTCFIWVEKEYNSGIVLVVHVVNCLIDLCANSYGKVDVNCYYLYFCTIILSSYFCLNQIPLCQILDIEQMCLKHLSIDVYGNTRYSITDQLIRVKYRTILSDVFKEFVSFLPFFTGQCLS